MATSPVRQSDSRMNAAWAIALTIAALYFAYDVLMPIALSVLLAFLLAPIVSRLERRGLPQVWAVLATVTLAFSVIGGLGYVVGLQIYNLGVELPNYEGEIKKKATQIHGFFSGGNGGGFGSKLVGIYDRVEKATTQPAEVVDPAAAGANPATAPAGPQRQAATRSAEAKNPPSAAQEIGRDPLAAVAGEIVPTPPPLATTQPGTTAANPLFTVVMPGPFSPIQTLSRYLGLILGPLGTAGLVIVFVVFVLLEREQLRDRLIRLVSGGNYTTTTAALNDATTRISRYMLAQSIVNGTYGVTISIGLFLIGHLMGGKGEAFPSFVLWGLLCALLRFIPYIGPWAAAAFPIALSLAVYPDFQVFLAVLAMFVVIELFSNNVMEPWLYGSSTGLSTVAILVAAVFWTWLWGPIGLLLSTPMTVCIVVLGRYTTQLHFLDVLLSDRPALPPPVRFYQRLLADDAHEAREIVRECAKEMGLARAADEVIVPALALMRRDRRNDHLDAAAEGTLLAGIREAAERFVKDPPSEPQPKPGDTAGGVADDAPPARVLAFPTHHRSEESALHLLPLGVDAKRFDIEIGSTRLLAQDVVAKVERERPAAVVLGVVPPGGITQTRYLCRRLRRSMPELSIVVLYFGRPKQFDRLLGRLRTAGAAYVTTSIAQTQSQLAALLAVRRPARNSTASPARAVEPKFTDGPATPDGDVATPTPMPPSPPSSPLPPPDAQ